jgi:hypothetical protein
MAGRATGGATALTAGLGALPRCPNRTDGFKCRTYSSLNRVSSWARARAILRRADLSQAPLVPIELKDSAGKPNGRKFPANLSGANLVHAIFDKANLTAAVLRGADITRARFVDATTEGMDLTGIRKLN